MIGKNSLNKKKNVRKSQREDTECGENRWDQKIQAENEGEIRRSPTAPDCKGPCAALEY